MQSHHLILLIANTVWIIKSAGKMQEMETQRSSAEEIYTSGEILTAAFAKSLPLIQYVHWLLPATLGNIVGGVVIVSVLNYGQVKAT